MTPVKKFVCGSLAVLLSSVLSYSAEAKSTVKFNPAKSDIQWVGKKVTGHHEGTIKLKSGHVTMEGDTVAGGEFEVDMKSLTVTDLTDADSNAKLTGHLKSDDFFGVEKYPTSKFVIKSVKALEGGAAKPTHEIRGDMTIKGKTNPLTFPATVTLTKNSVDANAIISIDRTKYDIRYGSGKFFENLGDKMIYDDFTLKIHLIGSR